MATNPSSLSPATSPHPTDNGEASPVFPISPQSNAVIFSIRVSRGRLRLADQSNQNNHAHPKNAVGRALIHRGAGVYQTERTLRTLANAPTRGWSVAKKLAYPEDMEE